MSDGAAAGAWQAAALRSCATSAWSCLPWLQTSHQAALLSDSTQLDPHTHVCQLKRSHVQVLGKDSRAVPAGGACEIEIARHLQADSRKATGLEQYAIAKYAEALEVSPMCSSRVEDAGA